MQSELQHDWTTQPRREREALKRLAERAAEHRRSRSIEARRLVHPGGGVWKRQTPEVGTAAVPSKAQTMPPFVPRKESCE